MQAGLTDHVWSMEELVQAMLDAEPCEAPEPRPLEPLPEAQRTTERETSTGVRLKAIDGGKARPKRPKRQRPQATIWDVLREARRKEEERGKPPPDEPPTGAA